jgi:DNA-binding NtrC family response regulator
MVDLRVSEGAKAIRVLLVDDDLSFLEISKQILMDMGAFEFDSACCVDEAFSKLATGSYDVVVSDYEMPQKDGLHFLTELREQHNQIPFILFTGKGREEVAIAALNLGADGYVNKQGSPETVYGELIYAVHSSVERRKNKLRIANDALAFQTVGDAIIAAGPARTITSWNKAAEEIFGWSTIEVMVKK